MDQSNFQKSQPGTGSAENQNQDREVQKNPMTGTSQQQKTEIAGEMGKGPNPVTDLRQMGGLSGRDDAAGGSGDRMEETSSEDETER